MHGFDTDEKEVGVSHVESTLSTVGETNANHEEAPEFKLTWGKFMAMLSFVLGYLSDTIAVTMVSAVLRTINADIGPSSSYTWIATSFTVGGAALAPIVGRLSDIFGRRMFLIVGNTLGIVGTAVAANGTNVHMVIAGGAIIGAASSMRQIAWAALGEIVPRKDRGLAFSLMQQSLALASAFGPVMAYGFVQNGSWRPVYWLPFALDVASLTLVFLFYHPINQYIHEEGKTALDQLKEIDWIGCLLFVVGIVVFLMGISFGGGTFPWASAGTIAPIVVGFALLCACGVFEAHMDLKYAIFPREIFRNFRGFTVLQINTFLLGMLYYSIAVLWPEQVQTLFATTPMNIGWYSAAPGFGALLTAPLFGLMQKKFGRSRWQLLFYTAALTAFCGAQACVNPGSHITSTILVIITFAFVGAVSIFAVSMIQVGVKHEYIGVASGIIVTARSTGGAVATTIYLSILQNRVTAGIPTKVAGALAENGVPLAQIPAVIEALTTGQTTSPALASISPKALMAAAYGLQVTYADAFRLVYLVSIAFGVIGTIIAAFANNVDHLMVDTVDIKLDEGAHIHAHTDTGEGHVIHHDKPEK